MTMPDLSALKLVEENIEVADDATYVDAAEYPPCLPEGVYTFVQGKPEFTATANGFLQAKMDHVVTGGDQDGSKLAFDRISNKPFERSGVRVNMMKDHLRALGDRSTCRTHQEYASALEAGEGKTFKAQVGWEGGCNHKDTPQECEWSDGRVFRAKGARAFPSNGNGKPSETIACPTCGAEVVARARISRRIAQ